jgi:hypothetical protein
MKNRWKPTRLALLCALGLSLIVAAGSAKTAQATTCVKGSCNTNADCDSVCLAYTGYPVKGVCSAHCCFCPE